MVFELLTGDYLFDPKEDGRQRHSRDEDHLALIMELVGRLPKKLVSQGKYSRDLFDKKGSLRNIKELDHWGLDAVLKEKYKMHPDLADKLASFLCPMLDTNPAMRASASDALKHPWMTEIDEDTEITEEDLKPRERYTAETSDDDEGDYNGRHRSRSRSPGEGDHPEGEEEEGEYSV